MLSPVYTKQFLKDMKLAQKRKKDTQKLKKVLEMLLNQQSLPIKYRDHWLVGNYTNRRECHIEPDWLLIYKPAKEEIIFERTGTHADLFK